MSRRCLWCGDTENITRDHVVSRVTLRLALGQEEYQRFCAKVRKINIQDLCGLDNNAKGDKSSDLRDDLRADLLREYLVEFGLDPDDILEDPDRVFPPRGEERE